GRGGGGGEREGGDIGGVTLATATAGEMPRNISSGVMRNPPPMPNMPEMNPTARPMARMTNTLTGRAAIGREISKRADLASSLKPLQDNPPGPAQKDRAASH